MLSRQMSRSEREELFTRIQSVLNGMPGPLQEVFVLSHYQGLSPSQIARSTGASEEMTRLLLARANKLFFRRLWPERGVASLPKSA
jgi:DNA-directed RNA polymerase specialized sigma24 family protein